MTMFFARKLNKKGFTLAELLIVVAIIAVLVAIAIPIFTGSLEKSRLGVHRSNARSLKSMGVALILGDSKFEQASSGSGKWVVYAKYSFETEKFTDYKVEPCKASSSGNLYGADAGDYFVNKNTNANASNGIGSGGGDDGNYWYKFGQNDNLIGKIPTDKEVLYAAIITEQDMQNASVTLIPGE